MAYQNGIVPTVGEYILLIIAATVGSMGAAPVPSAAIVMMRECILVFACIEWIWSRKLSETESHFTAHLLRLSCSISTVVAYSTAFGSTGTENPAGLAYIFAIE